MHIPQCICVLQTSSTKAHIYLLIRSYLNAMSYKDMAFSVFLKTEQLRALRSLRELMKLAHIIPNSPLCHIHLLICS